MNKTATFAAFIFGATVGSLVTWQLVKKKYEQIAQEEIDSVKEVFSATFGDKDVVVEYPDPVDINVQEPAMEEYTTKIQEEGYSVDEEPVCDGPHVIPPEEFDTIDGYDAISLTYYADQVLASDNGQIVEDIEGTIGFGSLGHFGEYEDDSVHVRNPRLKCDFEILQSYTEYSDILKEKPYLANKDEDNDET